ncbi:MAG TPA: hypothetical protein VG709_07590 [Actinomycetota bacterium]|nr:hypothetical protein [Actinomycetota bacterium]
MTDDQQDRDEGRREESEYPKAPGASKMEALERIERSLERQSEATLDRSDDAREDEEQPERDAAGDSDE